MRLFLSSIAMFSLLSQTSMEGKYVHCVTECRVLTLKKDFTFQLILTPFECIGKNNDTLNGIYEIKNNRLILNETNKKFREYTFVIKNDSVLESTVWADSPVLDSRKKIHKKAELKRVTK